MILFLFHLILSLTISSRSLESCLNLKNNQLHKTHKVESHKESVKRQGIFNPVFDTVGG